MYTLIRLRTQCIWVRYISKMLSVKCPASHFPTGNPAVYWALIKEKVLSGLAGSPLLNPPYNMLMLCYFFLNVRFIGGAAVLYILSTIETQNCWFILFHVYGFHTLVLICDDNYKI